MLYIDYDMFYKFTIQPIIYKYFQIRPKLVFYICIDMCYDGKFITFLSNIYQYLNAYPKLMKILKHIKTRILYYS